MSRDFTAQPFPVHREYPAFESSESPFFYRGSFRLTREPSTFAFLFFPDPFWSLDPARSTRELRARQLGDRRNDADD